MLLRPRIYQTTTIQRAHFLIQCVFHCFLAQYVLVISITGRRFRNWLAAWPKAVGLPEYENLGAGFGWYQHGTQWILALVFIKRHPHWYGLCRMDIDWGCWHICYWCFGFWRPQYSNSLAWRRLDHTWCHFAQSRVM